MKIIATTIAAAALAFSATSQADVREYCLSLSYFANQAAEVRDEGHSEREARSAVGTGHPQATSDLHSIISYVYTRPHLDPAVEASEVFDICIESYATGV